MTHFLKTLSFSALLTFCMASLATAQEPTASAITPSPTNSVIADIWPYEGAANVPPKVAFEQWRAQAPQGQPQSLAINGLSIPAREKNTIVRVSGILDAPITGHYRFYIYATGKNPNAKADATELWLYDDEADVWKLAQTSDNPFGREGRTSFEKGKPRRFELFTIGQSAVSVDWELRAYIPESKTYGLLIDRQLVPSDVLKTCDSDSDDSNGIGPSETWKKSFGLNSGKSIGPDSPWGDPDGDGLLNWQEQKHELNPLKADSKGASGMVLWEIWRNIPGGYVFDLRRAAHFPTGEREVRYLDRLIIPTGQGSHYGSRLRGFLIVPVDGKYTFKLRAEDNAELWLGTNDKWQTKRLIARTDERAGQRSLAPQLAEVTLKAGQKYYLEVLHKQDKGTDYCTIAWIIPGETQSRIISSIHLSAWQPCLTDTEDDGLPDEWQRSSGIMGAAVAQHLRHCEADADFDGASNRDEWLAGTNPLDAAEFPIQSGMLSCYAWIGVPGHHINALVKNPTFPAQPNSSIHIDNLDFKQEGDNYGLRIRGYLTAPEDGNYSFSIAGNNAAILYLGTLADKFTKRIVSRVEVGTNWRSYQNGGSENDGAISLEKGKKYYIEVIYKRGVNGIRQDHQIDHSSVAWTRPGSKSSVIPSEYFTPYQPDPRDLDDDDLPDDWEKNHGLDPADPSGKNGAWGDPDGDGLENFREFQRSLNPSSPDVHGKPGLALWEGWYEVEDLISAHRDGNGLAAALSQDERFPQNASSREWRNALDAPRRQGSNFGGRLRAHIVAPTTGEYIFSISGRDVGELYLSEDSSKFKRQRIAVVNQDTSFRQWEKRAEQMSAPVRLEARKIYYIEALYGRGSYQYADDFFSIGWKIPNAKEFTLINAKNLIAFHRDPNDQDDDDLPDDWEIRYLLDATNPRGDNGPLGDPDRDRYTNAEELRLGTDPNNLDTDGDGISDYDEIHTYHTNPLDKDTIPPVEIIRFPLASANFQTSTPWTYGNDGTLTSANRRGTLSFDFDVEKPGIYVLEVNASSLSATSYNPPIPFLAIVNGEVLGHADAASTKYTFSWLTQCLPAGRHTVEINNRNLRSGSSLALHSVKLLRHDGEDKDDNGIVDWLENIVMRSNRVDSDTLSSATSPACLEGTARLSGDVALAVPSGEIKLHAGIASAWYANVPLEEAKDTSLKASFENGAIRQNLKIQWTETNLLTCPSTLSVRKGDSLKVRAQVEGEKTNHTITHNGEKVSTSLADGCTIITFAAPGEHTIFVSPSEHSSGTSRTITVTAYDADFGKTLDLASGSSRNWSLPGVPHKLLLQADPILSLVDLARMPDQARCVAITSNSTLAASPVVLARLYEDGPIVTSTSVNSFYIAPSTVTNNSAILRILPDGTRVVRSVYAIEGKIPADLSIWIQMYVTDAVFANGDTWLHLTAADFDENGEATIVFYKAPGSGTPFICHWIRPYMEQEPTNNPE
jgi:hypothetical protein